MKQKLILKLFAIVIVSSLYPLNANAQSKKQQIEILKNRLDSVSILLKVQNESNTKNIEALNSKLVKLENQITSLNSEIKKSTENLQQKVIQNTELKMLLTNKSNSLNIALQEIEELKSDAKSIEALNSKILKLENQITSLNLEIKKSSENLQQKVIQNTELQLLLTNKSDSFNTALQEIEKLKSDAKKEQESARQDSNNNFMDQFIGKVYKMGEGENMVKVSFDLKNYNQDCGDVGQIGFVGSYWADGPVFTVDVNSDKKELTTRDIVNCERGSNKVYVIKYINDISISLTSINCKDSFFDGCGPYILTSKSQ
jgi:DNA repair exonuclease SbcCD ATPase subunit